MKVTLLNSAEGLRYFGNHPDNMHKTVEDKEHLAGVAASICVDKFDWGTDDYTKNMESAIASGHYSILEHLPLTWLIEDVSRALTHQLVRHRIASYSQQSQRYAKVEVTHGGQMTDWFVTPNTIADHSKNNYELANKYYKLMEEIALFYTEMCEAGIPGEDARFILPNAAFTTIVVSMNARAMLEACRKRRCGKAQWEIRTLFDKMRESIKDIYPHVYKMCVPTCETPIGCQEQKPCKKKS